jgi:DNA-binding transcriptional regulator YdaS (Cro superfamily)
MDAPTLEKILAAAGSKAELARLLGVTPQMVTKIIKTRSVPAKHCKRIEIITEGRVTAEQLRPDVFAPFRAA